MITVIADDITGAAEIAGIGLRFGLRVKMVTHINALPDCDLLVYASDTRSMTKEEAIYETHKIIKSLLKFGSHSFFKKTDSALRGYIVPELEILLAETEYERVLLIPQNPSRGRIIKDNIYYIDNLPINKTVFAEDPEFPALTSNVKERLENVITINLSDNLNSKGIMIGNAVNTDEIARYIKKAGNKTLLAGGADLFTAYMQAKGLVMQTKEELFRCLDNKNVIIVCGSTIGHQITGFDYFKRNRVPFCKIPLNVFNGASPDTWINELICTYKEDKSILLAVGHPSQGGKDFALRLREIIAQATSDLVSTQIPQELIIEGGATAFAIINKLEWSDFNLVNQITDGVVRMALSSSPQIHITLKPGSYSWGDTIFR